MGQMYEMMDDCDNIMDRYRMSHCQSCHVMDGHWLMYETAPLQRQDVVLQAWRV